MRYRVSCIQTERFYREYIIEANNEEDAKKLIGQQEWCEEEFICTVGDPSDIKVEVLP